MDAEFLLQTTSDGVAVTDAQGHFVYFNNAHRDLFGFGETEDMIGMSWRELYPNDEIERIERAVLPALDQHGHWQGILQAKRKNGGLFHERLSLSQLADGGILCICNEITDDHVTQSKMGEAWLDQSVEMERRSRLFSLANHEMRTPLASILLAAEMLNLSGPDGGGKKSTKLIGDIRNQAMRVGDMMDKFLFLGRQLSGTLPFSPSDVDLIAFLEEFSAEHWGVSGDFQSWVAYEVTGAHLVRSVDPVLFRHTIQNLVSNALKYRKPETPVKLSFDASHPQTLKFSVSNTGPKPDPGLLEQLFEPFCRHNFENLPGVQGSGLGLYLVKECVKSHSGNVVMELLPDGVCVHGTLQAQARNPIRP